jgi:AbrB family looped-hinge helix DNA binding protein
MSDLTTRSKTRISSNGRIVIPASMRELLGVNPGDTVLMDVEDGVLKIESYPTRVARIQRELAHLRKPGVLASDELIAERRAEARREEEEFERDAATVRKLIEDKIA